MDDDYAFDFDVSTAPASLHTHNDIWTDIKQHCREISNAKTKKKRGPALIEFQNMISSLKHQQVLHASGTWSFVITAIIQVIEEDFSVVLKKKNAASSDFKIDHEAMMHNLLDYAHTHTPAASSTAVLDRDAVGRTALKRLVSFCEAILVKPSLEHTPAETSALRILDKLFKFHAYCRAVDESRLKKVLEKALYILNDRSSTNLLLASKLALNILTNFQSDLHGRLPGFMEFFHQWFQDIRSDGEGTQPAYLKNVCVDAVARNVLSCMVVLMRQYGPHIAPLLQVHAQEAMRYVQRSMKEDVLVLSTEPVEFLIMYYRLVHFSAEPPSSTQVRELKQLNATCVLDDKLLATVVRHVATTFNARTLASFNEKAVLWLSMVADVVFYSDQWSSTDHSSKRQRHMTGLDTILHHLEVDAVSATGMPQVSQLTSTQSFKDVALPRLKWLLLVQALLARHGHWLVQHQDESLQTLRALLMKSLDDVKLEAECKEQTLQCLLTLSLYMRPGDPTQWQPLWHTLVSDFSFRNMTKFESGDAVLQLLSALVALNHVPVATLERDLATILEFPAFSSPSVQATLLLHLIQRRVDTESCKAAWPPHDIATYYFNTVAHHSFAPDGMGHAAPVLVSAIGSIVSDGPTVLDCSPYLVSALWVGCATCDLPQELVDAFSKRDAESFQVPRHAHLSQLAGSFAQHCRTRDGVVVGAPSRIAFPSYVDLKVTLEPSAFLKARSVRVVYTATTSQALASGTSFLPDEMQRLLGDVIEKCDTSTSDQYLVFVEALMNVGVVFAGVVDVFSVDVHVLLKNVLTAIWSRMPKWLASPNAVGLLQKLLCMLQLIGRSVCVDQDGKGKFPPSCRAILSCISTNVEEYIATQNNADVPDVDDDDADTSRWASVTLKKSTSRLWCLRIHQLLQYEQRRASMASQSSKQDDTSQLIRQVVEQNYVTALQCLALIPSLWRPLTNEGLSTIVFLLQSTVSSHPLDVCECLERVAVAVSRQQFKGSSASYDLGLVLDALLARRKGKTPRSLRRALVLAYEQLFLMDVDRFVDFSDYMMASFFDQDIGVQVASLGGLQAAYAKYDEGVVAIFNDVETLLKDKGSHTFVAVLACFVSAASADVLLSRVLSLYSLWFDAEPELLRACTEALATTYGFASPVVMLEDVCWSTLCHYVELGPRLKAKRDLGNFPTTLFDPSLPRLTESPLIGSFVTLAVLLDEANRDIHHVDEMHVPNLAALKPSVRVIMAWAKQQPVPSDVTPDMTLTILHYLLNLNAFDPEAYPLQWATFDAMVCRPVNLVDVALVLHAWLGEHRLKSFATEPIKLLCDAVDALAADPSNDHAISQRIVLHVLLQHADVFDVVCALKRVCDEWMREPDVFGQNLNHLISGLVLRYGALPMKNQEVVEEIAHAISRVQKLGKFVATLNPYPSHISPGLNQLQRSYNVDEPVLQTLAGKLTRPPLQTSPLTMEGLLSLQDIVSSATDEQHIPTIVHGLLANAYQSALRDSDTDKQVRIASCFGLMGAVFPADLLSHDVARLEVLYLQLFSRPSLAALSQVKDAWLELVGKLLECLILLLFESDGKVVHVAHDTLKGLLQLEEVQAAVNLMKNHSHGVKSFLQHVPAATVPPRPPPARAPSQWSPADHSSFRDWVCHVCAMLLKHSRNPTLAACVDICSAHERIAVFLLPLAIYTILGTDASELVMLEQLLHQESSLPPKHGQVLVQTIHYVRHLQTVKSQPSSWSLPYLQVAQLALRCKMPYSALHYVEHHLEQTFGTIQPSHRLAPEVTNILLQAYKEINAVDAIDGVRQAGHSLADQLTIYMLEKKYSDCLPLYDAIAHERGNAFQKDLAKTLHSLGYTILLETYLATDDKSSISKFQYQMAWKQSQWTLKVPSSKSAAKFDGLLYGCLKSMATNDAKQFQQLVVQAKTTILVNQNLSFTGLEMTKTLHKSMIQLETVAKLEAVWKLKEEQAQPSILGSSVADVDGQFHELAEKWNRRHSVYSEDFETYATMLQLEICCFNILQVSTYLPAWLLKLVKAASRANRVAVAFNALNELEKMSLDPADNVAYLMEKASVYYAINESSRALEIAKTVHSQLTAQKKEGLELAQVNSTIGQWLADMKAERSEVIHTKYLSAATQIFETMSSGLQCGKEASQAYRTLADYTFDIYNQVKTRVESNEWKRGKKVAEAQEAELRLFDASAGAQKAHSRHGVLRKQVEYDKRERHAVESSVDRFLTSTLKNYGLSLRYTADGDMTPVFRILSLWFRHFQNALVNQEVDEIIRTVPSYKFIPLSYQVISRLGTSNNNTNIQELVRKLTTEHPHHTIVQLLALKNGSKRGTAAYRDNIGVLKSEEAGNVLTFVKRSSSMLAALVENMEVLCDAYITLALHDTKEYERRGLKKIALANILVGRDRVPFDNCLRLRKFNQSVPARPAVLTYAIKPRSDGDYSNVPRVQSFEKDFTVTDSGVHKPKIIHCYGSDGIRRKQLVKGNDDTRQDLVIEQAFDIVNSFLDEDVNTRRRHLQIKTYKVTPLDTVAGVLEWVDNTMPMGGYLNGKPMDAHARYHPHEWKHAVCRSYIQKATDKYQAYMEIQDNFTPVFHHYFLEKYPDPATWYARREAYTRSVAVTSIVGHILGIGDRHSQNILIDEASGELVHIDFGVVFDQGMTLITPETVPFRLTRDVVDGMGVNGVDGVFTRCCEETLKVLRKKGNALTTIVEVFIHDPLYNWTLSPGRALQVQKDKTENDLQDASADVNADDDDDNVADLAARVLLRVKQKLQGYEDPTGEAMSVEGQVKHLIQVARDPHNLCKIYPGWGPWL